jgi:hypothetical protein
MKGMTLAALAAATLLCACAETSPVNGQNDTVASRADAPLGSYIKRKPGSGNDNTMLDKQALENERQMNNGSINLPVR